MESCNTLKFIQICTFFYHCVCFFCMFPFIKPVPRIRELTTKGHSVRVYLDTILKTLDTKLFIFQLTWIDIMLVFPLCQPHNECRNTDNDWSQSVSHYMQKNTSHVHLSSWILSFFDTYIIAQHVVLSLNKKSCRDSKTTTAWKSILYRFWIPLYWNPRESSGSQFGRYQKNILQEWFMVKRLSFVSCAAWHINRKSRNSELQKSRNFFDICQNWTSTELTKFGPISRK